MRENRNRNNHRNSHSRDNSDIIPSSQILEKFEDAVPGSVENLIEMAAKEQDHRHTWQEKYLKSHNFTFRVGQIFGLVYNLALLYIIYNLVNSGQQDLALKLFSINASIMVFAILVTALERRIFSRRPPRRGAGRHDNRKQPGRDNRNNNRNESRDSRPQTRKPRAE